VKLRKLNQCKTVEERWTYHSQDYAWRRLRLGRLEKTTPVDPEGMWYDEQQILQAIARLKGAIK
jgi:hypothetical protein